MNTKSIICLIASLILGAVNTLQAQEEPFFILNDDACRTFAKRYEVSEKTLTDFVDTLANGSITHLSINVNAMRASYKSNVIEAVWEDVDMSIPIPPQIKSTTATPVLRDWQKNCKLYHEKGILPFKVLAQRCKEKNITPWISIRMNDVHHANDWYNQLHSNFWRKNPQLWRVEKSKAKGWNDFAFDYSHKIVRDRMLALIEEAINLCEVDGVELDWQRFGEHLPPNKAKENAHYLTDVVREAKKICDAYGKKKNRKITLAVRVPPTLENSKFLGMNADDWAKEGLVDFIIPSPFFHTDYSISVNDWQKSIGKEALKNVKIIPCSEGQMKAYPAKSHVSMDIDFFYAWATQAFFEGAKNLYSFNLTYFKHIYENVKKEKISVDVMRDKPRRHPVAFRDLFKSEFKQDRLVQFSNKAQQESRFVINCGFLPTKQKNVSVVLGFDDVSVPDAIVYLNGQQMISSSTPSAKFVKSLNSKSAKRYTFKFEALKEGVNVVEIKQQNNPIKIDWVEIDIR